MAMLNAGMKIHIKPGLPQDGVTQLRTLPGAPI
jgi:hypothetical protein